MSLACQVAQGFRSPCSTSVPSGSRRIDDAVEAGVDEQAPVGEPAQARGLAVEVHLDPALAVGRDREDGVVEEVRVPEPAVVPARAFAEEEAGDERLGSQGFSRHAAHLHGPGGIRACSSAQPVPGAGAARRGYLWHVTYWVLKAILTPIFYVLWRVKVEGRENIPKHGPAVLAANHQSFCDSFFIPLVVRRKVTFLAKAEYFDSWKTAWFFRAAGQIPIRRGGGSVSERALDTARNDVLGQGAASSACIRRAPGPSTPTCTRGGRA